MAGTCEKDLDILIRARYPLIFIVSYEESRIEALLRRVTGERNKQLFIWAATTGIRKAGDTAADERTRDPLAALEHIEKQNAPAIFLLRDFHPYLSDPTIVRKFRDLVENLKSTYETVVLVSPVLTIPVELEKDVAVLDFDLPDRAEIERLLDSIVGTLREKKNVSLDELTPEVREHLVNAALGLTLNEAENAFARVVVTDNALGPRDVERIQEEKKQVIRKSGMLDYFAARETIGDVGGLGLLKDWLDKRSAGFTQKAREFGLPEPKGILLLGVQGCGKSLTAKAIATLWKLPLLRFDVGRVFAGIVGSSEENMRRAIKTAESIAPAILWIDEIEKSLAGVQSSGFSDGGTSARVFGTFLTWLQEKTGPVFVVATANNIKMLPPELLRKGRFDEIFFIDLPAEDERREIFAIHLRRRKRNPADFDLDALARMTADFSGSEIEQIVVSGLFDAFTAGRDLATADMEAAVREAVPLARTMQEDIAQLREWARTRTRPASRPFAAAAPAGRKLEIDER